MLTGPLIRQKVVEWVLECEPVHNHVDKLLTALDEAGIKGLPLTCRTLLGTDTNIKTIYYNSDTELYFYNVEMKIVNNLMRYDREQIRNLEVVELQLHYDGLPVKKSSADTLWPLLASFYNIHPTAVFPLNFAMCQNKPTDISYLDRTIEELVTLTNLGINFCGQNLPVVIKTVVADAPARALIKSVKGHTGNFCCGKCCERGTWVENRMVFLNTDNFVPRSDQDFRQRIHENHHLPVRQHGPSPLLPLPINMVEAFPQDYMHCVCLGK